MGDNDYAGGPTDWKQWSVPQLAEFFAEDHSRAYGHASAWYRTASVADSYRKALQRIRDGLAKAWAPREGSAAAAYLARLDSMIGSLADVHGAALSNGEALNGVLTTLDGARRRMDQIHDEWRRNDRPLLQAGQPELVTSDWKTPLNQVAWQHMQETDTAVYEYIHKLTPPMSWSPGPGDPIDPIQPDRPAAGSAGGGSGGGFRVARPPAIPAAHFPEPPSSAPASGGTVPAPAGPVLTGGPGPAGSGGVPDSAGGSGPAVGHDPWSPWMIDTPRGRVLRAGAVIGMPPPAAGGSSGGTLGPEPGQRSARSPAAPSEPVNAAGGAAEREGAGFLGGAGGVGARSGQDRRRPRSEAYVEWEVPKGVPPVLEPGPEPVHDPGPGVIGIDR